MDFDDAERSEATQTLELSEEDYKEDGLLPLRYVKFQNVNSVTVRPCVETGLIWFFQNVMCCLTLRGLKGTLQAESGKQNTTTS